MEPILTVIGATGTQGGSVVAAALRDRKFKVRGVTRNLDSEASRDLISKGVEMIQADVNDKDSLVAAFRGSDAIFAMTNFWAELDAKGAKEASNIEAEQGINLARAATVTRSLKHYVWSTVPDYRGRIGAGHIMAHFDGKIATDRFIKQHKDLLEKTTFLWVTYYATNILMDMIRPSYHEAAGKYLQLLPVFPSTEIVSIGDPSINIGIYTLAILNQPGLASHGNIVRAEAETLTIRQTLDLWSEVFEKPVWLLWTSPDSYTELWGNWGREIGTMLQWWSLLGRSCWAADKPVLTGEDLKITGLVGTKEVFCRIKESAPLRLPLRLISPMP
ncbi:hypothetical protein NUU61_001573 [Penicillium alfredii]|uniref:NmrA-like domain-containing protein n=1 Tax=Penicillium alfredii TaxID=1506179 RepID=A0A9W9KNF5_9EURO|nr:uncharacterized protein NUU61_001300 [Penicillium alfredii]XP_056515422.1 uncharacterized protein NUU61_001573 [Penicillium alfredii]KAJ5111670.1 hypothetical protein NUU61_001300 [Penicillium alfredii]KAJ5111943.1 hypothetical protein NUU61_001573 [Penicillium alfredii]